MNRHFLKGDSGPKVTPKASHPWRRAIFPAAEKAGRYNVNGWAIECRRAAQLAAARAHRNEARNG